MLFTLLGMGYGIYDAIDDDDCDGFGEGLFKTITGGLVGLMADSVLLGVPGLLVLSAKNRQLVEDKAHIEENIADGANFAKFTGNAFTVIKNKDEYFTEIFGVAIEEVGSEPRFSSVTYKIDKETYDKIFKYVDIKYEYNQDGQIVSAINDNKVPEWFFGRVKTDLATYDIFKRLVEITETEVVSKHIFGNVEQTQASLTENEKQSNLLVSGVGEVQTNKGATRCSFTVDLIEEGKEGLVAKRLLIIQDYTKEIAKDPMAAYDNYAKNPNSCSITVMAEGKQYMEAKSGYMFEMPEDLLL